jgi:hypothetical protein
LKAVLIEAIPDISEFLSEFFGSKTRILQILPKTRRFWLKTRESSNEWWEIVWKQF